VVEDSRRAAAVVENGQLDGLRLGSGERGDEAGETRQDGDEDADG
jgi:hypothetical protein